MTGDDAREAIDKAHRALMDATIDSLPRIPEEILLELSVMDDRVAMWRLAESMAISAMIEKHKHGQTEIDAGSLAACIVHAMESAGFHR